MKSSLAYDRRPRGSTMERCSVGRVDISKGRAAHVAAVHSSAPPGDDSLRNWRPSIGDGSSCRPNHTVIGRCHRLHRLVLSQTNLFSHYALDGAERVRAKRTTFGLLVGSSPGLYGDSRQSGLPCSAGRLANARFQIQGGDGRISYLPPICNHREPGTQLWSHKMPA